MSDTNDFDNTTDDFFDRNLREGRGEHPAIIFDGRRYLNPSSKASIFCWTWL